MTIALLIPQRQLENTILNLNREGFTVVKSNLENDEKITIHYRKNFDIIDAYKRRSTIYGSDIMIKNTKKTHRISSLLHFFWR